MEVRLLKQQEHGKTRLLWEKVFQEDSKAFLDYYYFFKTRENSVYVVEEDEEIRSMLHLNPFLIQVRWEHRSQEVEVKKSLMSLLVYALPFHFRI